MSAKTGSVASMESLKTLLRTLPVIDNHAHNILVLEGLQKEELIAITSEASGAALEDAHTSLAHLRALRQLRSLYDLASDANWDAIVKKRSQLLEQDPISLTRKCLRGIHTILIDDGYEDPKDIEPYEWHDQFTLSRCKRIVRIEEAAADVLEALHEQGNLPTDNHSEDACRSAWKTFVEGFERVIRDSIDDDEVVGFKSIICYTTGLQVDIASDEEMAFVAFKDDFLPTCIENDYDMMAKPMSDFLVLLTCRTITAAVEEHGTSKFVAKPFQFHTGLGSNNMPFLYSNPAYMQPLIEHFPAVPFVLLHSSYPFTREAGYMASVFKNAYLDIGLVWPELSRDGQETVIRQALELTPWSKLLWSTDGHSNPETYFLSNIQGRKALEKVVCEYVENEDWSIEEATKAVRDIYFENSNRLYSLGLKTKF